MFAAPTGAGQAQIKNRRVPREKTLNAREFLPASWATEFRLLAVIVGLLLIGTGVVYATGGTGYAFPYVQLAPALIAAARYGITGGVLAAFIGALLLGPLMSPAPAKNWAWK